MTNTILQKLNELDLGCTEILSITEESDYTTERGKQLPPFTKIQLVSKPSETSYIRHELWLPDNWNGIFLGTGNGGIAGKIAYKGLELGTGKNCATINTDMGTSTGRVRGVKDAEVWKDYGWRATYLMTKVGKQITEAFYGEAIKHCYFHGTSTGGQQSLMLAQRYPAEYEGIIAGVPANYRTHLHTYFLWSWNKMRGKGGELLFTPDDIPLITEKAYEFCAEKGYIAKGQKYIPRPDSTKEFIREFVDYLGRSLSFTEEQKSALFDIYVGPYDSKTGEQIYFGMPIGSECNGKGLLEMFGQECPHYYPFLWVFGRDYNGLDFDFSDDMRTVDTLLAEDLNANNADLSAFFDNGGKLFMYSGSADPCVPFQGALQYFSRVSTKCTPEKTHDHMRYFIIPGHNHGANVCAYGRSKMNGTVEVRDNVDIIRKWCEEEIAPECFAVITPNGAERVIETIYALDGDKL